MRRHLGAVSTLFSGHGFGEDAAVLEGNAAAAAAADLGTLGAAVFFVTLYTLLYGHLLVAGTVAFLCCVFAVFNAPFVDLEMICFSDDDTTADGRRGG